MTALKCLKNLPRPLLICIKILHDEGTKGKLGGYIESSLVFNMCYQDTGSFVKDKVVKEKANKYTYDRA